MNVWVAPSKQHHTLTGWGYVSSIPCTNSQHRLLGRDMLGAPSNIAGAPSNSMKGQFCPSVKNIKSISFLPGSILSFSHCGSSAKSFFSSLFPDKLLLRELLRQPLDPFAFEVGGLLLSFGFVMHYIRVG